MKKICLLIVFIYSAIMLQAQDLPPKTSLVNDCENVFSDKEEKTLGKLLKKVSKAKSDHVVFVSVASYEPYDNIESFSYALINEWKLGSRGVLIVFSKNKRSVRIETSSGVWDRLSDEEAQSIIELKMIPEFKKAEYFNGLIKGIEEIKTELEEKND